MGRRTTKTTTKTTSITKAAKATTSCCVWLSYLLVTDALLPCNFSHTAYYNFLSLSGGRHSGCYSRTGIASSQRATFQDVSVRYDSALKFQRQLFGRCYDSSSGSTARRYPHQSSQNESFSIGNEEYDDWLVQNLLDEWANSKKQDRSIEKMTEKLTNLRRVEAQKRSSGNSSWSTRNNNLNNSNPDEDQQSWQQIQRSMISYSTRSTNNSNEMPPPNDKKTLQNFSPLTGISTLTSLVALRYYLVNRPSVKEEELQDVSRRTDLEIPTHYYPDRFLFEKAVRDLDRWKENQEAWKKGMVMSGAAGVMAMGMVAGTIEGANAMVGTVEDEGRILMASQSSGVVGSGSSFSSISHTVSSGKTDTKGAPSSSSSFASSSPIVRSDFASAVPVEEKNSESVVIDHDSDDTSRTFTATNLNEQTVTGAIDNNENHMASSAADPSTSSPLIIAVNNINEVLLTETNTPLLTSATTMKDHAAMTQRLQTLWSAISSTSEELDILYSELDNLEEEYSMNDVASSRQAAAVATTYRPASQTTIPQDDDPIFRAWSTRSDDDVDMSTGEDENRMKSSSMTTASTSIPTTEPIAYDSTGPMFRVWSGQNDDDNGVISTEEETRYVHSSSAMNAAASIPTPEPATLENSGPMFRVWSRQSDDDIDVRFSEDETSNIRSSSMTTATASVPTSEPAVQKNSGPMFRVWSRQPDDDFSVRLSEESSSNIRSLSTTTATASVPTSEPAVQENSGPMFRVWSKQSDDDIHVNFREDESGSNIRSSSMTTTTASIPTSEPSVQENSGPMFRVWSRQSDDDFSVRLSEESSSNIRSSSTTTATASIPTPEPAARRGSGPMFRVWSSQSDDNIAVDFREEIISTRSPNAATVTTSASASTPAPDPAFQKSSGPMFHVWSKQSDDDFAVSLGEQDSISQSSSVSTSIASVPTTETEIGQGNGPLFHGWGTQSDDGIIVKIEDENYIGSSSTVVASVDASSLVTSDNEADAMRGPQEQFWSSQEGDDFAVTLNESNIAEKSGAEAATIYTEAPSDNDPLSPYSIRYDGRTRRGEFGTISGFESPIVTKTAEDAFVRSSSAIKAFEKDDISASNGEKSSIQFGADLNNVVDVYAAIIKRDERAAKDAISGISSEAVGFAVGLAGSAIADRTVSLRRQSNAN